MQEKELKNKKKIPKVRSALGDDRTESEEITAPNLLRVDVMMK